MKSSINIIFLLIFSIFSSFLGACSSSKLERTEVDVHDLVSEKNELAESQMAELINQIVQKTGAASNGKSTWVASWLC